MATYILARRKVLMPELYLITHAHTRQQPGTNAREWALSEIGQEQAAALATLPLWSGVGRIILSSEPKTRLTVEPSIAAHKLDVLIDPRFDELQRGPTFVDDYVGRVAQVFAHPTQSIGGWEPAAEALARIQAGLTELKVRFPDDNLALIGHGLTLSLYRAYLIKQEFVDLDDWRRLSFAAVARVDLVHDELLSDFVTPPGAPQIIRG